MGSAIYNSGTINIQDSVISENNLTTSEEINLSGGAIYNNGTMNVDGALFYMNAINATTMAANGGAIYNDGSMAVNDSIFDANNSVSERHARGGAIRNNSGTQYITNSSFAYNYANSTSLTESNTTALGGAIYNEANLYIENTAFYKNHTNGFTAHGGAIQNAGNLTIVSSIFDGNYSEGGTQNSTDARGGAIYNTGNLTLIDTSFINNYVTATRNYYGAAMYINSTTNIIAKNQDVLFEGNYSRNQGTTAKLSNGIFVNSSGGELNLNAGAKNIIFNDIIAGAGQNFDTFTISINKTGTWDDTESPFAPDGNKIPVWAPTTGTIELNEDMSGYAGNVYIYGGTVKLGEDRTNVYSASVTPKFFAANNLNLYGGTIDLRNKKIDNVTITNFNGADVSGTALGNLMIDADLSAGTADNFTVSGTAAGYLNISGVNILTDGSASSITVFNNGNSPVLNGLTTYTNNKKYIFTPDSTIAGVLNINTSTESGSGVIGFDGLKEALADTSSMRSFSLTENYISSANLGAMQGENSSFLLFGNRKSIDGNQKEGFLVAAGQTMTIRDVGHYTLTEVSESTERAIPKYYADGTIKYYNLTINNPGMTNFRKYDSSDSVKGGVIKSAGTINISDSVFSNNNILVDRQDEGVSAYGSAIYNTGNLTLTNSLFSNNASYGNVASSVIHNYEKSSLTVKGSIFVNNSTTIFGAGDNCGAIYNDEGDLLVIDSVFSRNIVDSDTVAYGAAIGSTISYGTGQAIISNSIFNENKVSSTGTEWIYGGAVHSPYSHIIISNSMFTGNSVSMNGTGSAYGGALYGRFIVSDTSFVNNAAIAGTASKAYGGAISVINTGTLIAKDKDVLFEGNYTSVDGGATKVSDAIYLNKWTLNLNAGNHKIIFNDRITGANTSGKINVNQTGTWDDSDSTVTNKGNYIPIWAGTTGTIELNEDMSGYTGDVNIYSGTVKLGENRTNTYSQAVTPVFFAANNLNLYGGTVDLQNKKIDTVTITNFSGSIDDVTGEALANLKIDADMSSGMADNFTISGTSTGKLNITGINILADGDAQKITVFNNGISPELTVINSYTNAMKYVFEADSENAGVLQISSTVAGDFDGFTAALADTGKRSFSATGDVVIKENLAQMQGTKLTIFGNKHAFDGGGFTGLSTADGQNLEISEAGAFTLTESADGSILRWSSSGEAVYYNLTVDNAGLYNFSGEALHNAGTASIEKSVISNTITNTGTLSASNVLFSDAVTNTGTMRSANSIVQKALNNSGTLNLYSTSFNGQDSSLENTSKAEISGSIFNKNATSVTNSGELDIKASLFNENTLAVDSSANAQISDSTFLKNASGVKISAGAEVEISNSGFGSNTEAAIEVEDGKAIISDGEFSQNATAIKVSSGATAEISNSKFNNNTTAITSSGSVVINASENSKLSFDANTNGAIKSTGTLTINGAKNSTISFANNTGSSAIDAAGLNIAAEKLIFTDNASGAIKNSGTGTISASELTFTNSSVVNSGDLSFSTDTGSITFDENSDVDNTGTLSVITGTGAKANLNGMINGGNIVFNASNGGDIYLNNRITNANISLNSGKLSVEKEAYFSGSSLELSGSLNIANNEIGTINLTDFTSNNGDITFDADLSSGNSDSINASSAAGTLGIRGINIINDGDASRITLFNNASLDVSSLKTYSDTSIYTFEQNDTDKRIIDVIKANTTATLGGIANAAQDTTATKAFSATRDTQLEDDFGVMGGTTFTIFGNKKDIDGKGFKGLSVASGQNFYLENAGFSTENAIEKSVHGFSEGFLTNSGKSDISASIFTKNSGTLISNSGTNADLIIVDTLFQNNSGTILNNAAAAGITNSTFANNAAAVINSGDISLNNTLFTNNTETTNGIFVHNAGTLKMSRTTFKANNGGSLKTASGSETEIKESWFGTESVSDVSSALNGAAIFSSGVLGVFDTEFISNRASDYGGAIYALGSSTFERLLARHNEALYGGVLYNNYAGGTNSIKSSDFTTNRATSKGGAIYADSSLVFESANFGDGTQGGKNTAAQGGAIYTAGADLELSDSNFKMNEASDTHGGAIYAETGSKITSTGTVFASNSAKNSGGAIYLRGAALELSSGSFTDNTALNGGALYIDETSSAVIKDAAFTSNLVKGTDSKGGAIYNAGTLTLTADTADMNFSGNKASDKINDIYTTGNIIVNGSKNVNITGGFAGEGTITKEESGVLKLSGNNSSFLGNVVINNGAISYNKAQESDKFFGGTVEIIKDELAGKDGVLDYTTALADTISGKITGNGTFNKLGIQSLTLTGDNSGFVGAANINSGTMIFEKSDENAKFFNGETNIAQNAVLEFNLSVEDTLSSILKGEGTFKKQGAQTLTVKGGQDGFSGVVKVDGGKLLYEKTEDTDKYFSGTTEIASGANVELNLSKDETFRSQFKGAGSIIKSGSSVLNLTNDNSDFSGNVSINSGKILFQKGSGEDNNDKYFGGLTTIADGAALEFNIAQNAEYLIDKAFIDGSTGTFNKTGAGTFIVTGRQDSFSGDVVIDGGKLTYIKNSDSDEYFSGNTIINAGATFESRLNAEDTLTISKFHGKGTFLKTGSATLTLTGDQSVFEGITLIEGGKIVFDKLNEDDKYFSGQTVIEDNKTLEFNIAADEEFSGTLQGSGEFVKTGSASLIVNSDNTGFNGNTIIEAGNVIFTKESDSDRYFGGTTTVEAGAELMFALGTEETLNSSIEGSGVFTKTGDYRLDVEGNQSGFNGVVNVFGGTLAFSSRENKKFFNAASINITSNSSVSLFDSSNGQVASLEYTFNENGTYDKQTNLNGAGVLNLNANGVDVVINNTINTSGENNTANFTGQSFTLAQNAFANFTGDTNKAVFSDTTIKAGTNTAQIGNNEFNAEFKNNSALDLRNGNGAANGYGIADAVFDNLLVENGTKLFVDIDLKNHSDQSSDSGEAPAADRIIAANGSGNITLSGVAITRDGLWANKEVQILDTNGITLNDFNPYLTATSNSYLYEIKNSSTAGNILISTVDYNVADTLKTMHQLSTPDSSRGFTVNASNSHYITLSSLGEMGAGTFNVNGIGADSSSIDANNLWTLFNADSTDGEIRELNISAITIQNATTANSTRKDGAAIYANGEDTTVTVTNTLMTGNNAQNGGAIYSNNAEINVNTSEFNSNIAQNAGGALNNSGTANINNSIFTNNEAKQGGAIANTGTMTISDSSFDSNKGETGGALYNTGNLTIKTTGADNRSVFSSNTANGVSNDIYSTGTLTFSGGGTVEINSGIAGSGSIIKNDGGILNLKGKNDAYNGTTTINDGKIVFDKTSDSDTMLVGEIITNKNGTLEFKLESEHTIEASLSLSGDGTILKTGKADLAVSADRSGFTGTVEISDGNLNYTQKTAADKYFGGSTVIGKDGALNIETAFVDNIKNLSGSGDFNKTGAGKLILSGDNSEFKGVTTIKNGTLSYDNALDTTEFVTGQVDVTENGTLELMMNRAQAVGGNIKGSGNLVKTGSETLELAGNNSIFSGIFTIEEGKVAFERKTGNVYIGGNTVIASGAELEYTTTENDRINGTISSSAPDAVFTKLGAQTLTLGGDNSVFNGKIALKEGTIAFDNKDGAKYFGGTTEISSGAKLIYTTTSADSINGTISGAGELVKSGEENLAITGDNSSFSGLFTVENGTASFSNDNGNIYFSGTTNLVKDELTNKNGIFDYTAVIDDTLNAGFSGNGTFNKYGAAELSVTGDNTVFTGDVNIKEGTLSFNNENSNKFFAGTTTVENGAVLDYTTTGDETVNGNISGNGTLNKNGSASMILKGDNSGFDGTVNINEGKILFNKTDDGQKYFAGTTNIQGELEYNLNVDETLGKITGNGTFTKSGNAELTINTDNSGFSGNAVVESGSMTFTDATGGKYFAGTTSLNNDSVFNVINDSEMSLNGLLTTGTNSGVLNKQGSGTLIIKKDNSNFHGTVNVEDGVLSYVNGASEDKFFASDAEISISENAELNLDTNSAETISNKTTGSGTITKTGAEMLTINGDNKGFTGSVNIEQGTMKYEQNASSSWFGGTTSIENGAELVFNNANTDSIKNLSGDGTFTKEGAGNLNLSGNNSGFIGTANIADGTVSFNDYNNKFFGGTVNVENANLDYTLNSNGAVIDKNINLNGNANLNYSGTSSAQNIAINTENTITGDNNTVSFNNGTFEFNADMKNFGQNGEDNKITFGPDTTVKIGSNVSDFGSDKLNADFDGTNLDLVNDKTTDLTFNELNFSGDSTIRVDLDLKNNEDQINPERTPSSDKISYNTGSGSVTLNNVNISVNGLYSNEEITVLEKADSAGSDVVLNMADTIISATTSGYEYEIKKSANEGNILVSTVDYANPESLKKMHNSTNEVRNFNFDEDTPVVDGKQEYKILSDLGSMGADSSNSQNQLNVSGIAGKNSTITGSGAWEGFNVDSSDGLNRELNLNDVIIADMVTNTRTDGSGVYVNGTTDNAIANITNTGFVNNTADGKGGAVYNEGGLVNIENGKFEANKATDGGAAGNSGTMNVIDTAFDKNTSSQNGGAITNSGEINISNNSSFTSNTSQNNGGALHNTGNATITDSSFSSNTAQNGNGGAIYNSGTLNINATENHTTDFSGNTANGQSNDIYNDGGTINFGGKGEINVESGIAGDGSIVKDDSSVLNISGKNDEYTGTTTINNGKIVYTKDDANDSFLGGTTTIVKDESAGKNGVLEFNLIENDTLNASFNGNGTFVKEGSGTLTVNGNHENFAGDVVINDGVISFENSTGNKYFGGTTVINKTDDKTGTFEFIANGTSTMPGIITGNGNFDKKGSGELVLSGDNSGFTGTTTIKEGSLTFEKTDTSKYFSGSTVLEDTTLNYITTTSDTMSNGISGTGTINKLGSETLTINGNNDAFTGDFNIKEGSVLYNKLAQNDSFFGGQIIMSAGTTLDYNAAIDDVLSGKIEGSDATIRKTGAGTLTLSGDNSGFSGNTVIKEGSIIFNKETSEDKFFVGSTEIQSGASLEYALSENDSLNGKLTGDGTFIKSGSANLTLKGANNTFTGTVNLNEGKIIYIQSADDKYFGGATVIASGAQLDYTNDSEDFMKDLSGQGTFVKKGAGVLEITGENKNFYGEAIIESGALSYVQSGGSFFSGTTTINKDAVLSFTNTTDDKVSSLKGDGKFVKKGEGTAFITGNGSAFTGEMSIEEGKLKFEKLLNTDALSSGNVSINNGAELEMKIENDYSHAGTISGNGKLTKSGAAIYTITGDNTSFTGEFVLAEGTVNLAKDSKFFNAQSFTMYGNTTFSTLNNSIEAVNLGNLNISSGVANLAIDVDLQNRTSDFITANSVSGTGSLNINNIKLLSDSFAGSVSVQAVDSAISDKVTLDRSQQVVMGPIYQYLASYDAQNGVLNFAGGPADSRFNPGILAAPVAAQVGGYLTQLNSYDDAFANMDMLMLMPRAEREAYRLRNKYAAADSNLVYNPTMIPEAKKGAWFRPFTNIERVNLGNGLKVNNVAYGSLIGVDSDLIPLKRGFEGVFTAYAAYNGSNQDYRGISINQNGGLLGGTAVFYRGNFFTGLTINAGASVGDASTFFGKDTFTMITAGVASKTGYNWELLNGKFVIQPSWLMSYSFVDTLDFRTKSGIKITSDALNAVQLAPGIKFIGNLKDGWQPYASITMVWNIMNDSSFNANDVSLPELAVEPYVQYGVGVQKRWGERFTGYLQTMFRNGGRNGVGFNLGLRWRI